MTLHRINRIAIAPQPGAPAWAQVDTFAGLTWTDLEVTEGTALELQQPRIATTGQRGDGETSLGAAGNRDAAPSLTFYPRGIDLAAGAGNGINTSTGAPAASALIAQACGGSVTDNVGNQVSGVSTRWLIAAAGHAFTVGTVVGWVNPAGKLEVLPVVEVNAGVDFTVAGDGVALGGFSSAPIAGNDLFAARTFEVDQQAGERGHVAVHALLANGASERFALGCLGSVSFSDADGLLAGTWAAQAHDWRAASELAGPPAFAAFSGPVTGPVSTRDNRVILSTSDSWGVSSVGHTPASVAVAEAISGDLDLALDVQPRAAVNGVNGRQGFAAVENACSMTLRLYHDGSANAFFAGGSETFGDGALLQLSQGQGLSVGRQYGSTPGNVVFVEILNFQGDATQADEGGLSTIDIAGRGYRPAFGGATARVHLL